MSQHLIGVFGMSATRLGTCQEQTEGPAAHSRPTSPAASYPSEQTRDVFLGRSTITPDSTAVHHAAQQQLVRGHAAMLQQAQQHMQQQQQQENRCETQIQGSGRPQTASRVLQVSVHGPRQPGSATALPAQLRSAMTAPQAVAAGQLGANPAEKVTATAAQPSATQAAAAEGTKRHASSKRAASALDAVLMQQDMALEPLLPTPTNINPIHVPGTDLLQLIAVQQWVGTQLSMKLPLLNGMFVLVPSAESSQHLQTSCRNSTSSSRRMSSVTAAIPWRLRQVLSVEVSAGVAPADATVLLVGGDRVRAGAVGADLLADVQDYQYLCCELAHMQQQRQMCQLQVLDVAHMAWRLKVACELEEVMRTQQECTKFAAAEQAACQHPSTAADPDMDMHRSCHSILRQLPLDDWVGGQVLQYIELNPIVWPDSPDQPWQLLSDTQYSQLLQDAAEAWQHYVQQKLARQQPQPVLDFVPWLPICADDEQQQQQQQQQQEQQQAQHMSGDGKAALASSSIAHDGNAATGSDGQPPGAAKLPQHQAESSRGRSRSRRGDRVAASILIEGSGSKKRSRSRGSMRTGSRSKSVSRGRAHRRSSPSVGPKHRGRSNSPSCSRSSEDASMSHSSTSLSSSRGTSRRSSRSRDTSASSSRRCRSRSSSQSHGHPSGRKRRRRSSGGGSPCCGRSRSQSPVGLAITCSGTSQCFSGTAAEAAIASWLRQQPTSQYFNALDPWSQYVEVKVQAFLQQLAVKVTAWSGPPPLPGRQPYVMDLAQVLDNVLLPDVVRDHYHTIQRFVSARAEIQWVSQRQRRTLLMDPAFHALLLARAQLSFTGVGSSVGRMQQQQQQPKEEAEEVAGWPEYLADQQQELQLLAAAATAEAAAAAAAAQSPHTAAAAADGRGGTGTCEEPGNREMQRHVGRSRCNVGGFSSRTA